MSAMKCIICMIPLKDRTGLESHFTMYQRGLKQAPLLYRYVDFNMVVTLPFFYDTVHI
jgi:hypothetical protein